MDDFYVGVNFKEGVALQQFLPAGYPKVLIAAPLDVMRSIIEKEKVAMGCDISIMPLKNIQKYLEKKNMRVKCVSSVEEYDAL